MKEINRPTRREYNLPKNNMLLKAYIDSKFHYYQYLKTFCPY